MGQTNCQITRSQKEELVSLLRRLPGILSGRFPDEQGIATGFKARLGFAALSLIHPNFNELGRGMPGADGDKWRPLSKEYLAYGRRFGMGEQTSLKKSAGLGKGNRHGGPKDQIGLLTKDQSALWRRTFADRLAWFIMREPDHEAKAHAAAIAWVVVKKAGGKTKLEVFGNRQVQILVDTGQLRNSLMPGTLSETGVGADYTRPSGNGAENQVMDVTAPGACIVGTNDKKAGWHHDAKNPNRRRRLWPTDFPSDWWNQILGQAIGGLVRIGELFRFNGGN